MNKDSLYHDMASDNIFLLKYFRISRTFAFGSEDLASTVSYHTLLRRHHSMQFMEAYTIIRYCILTGWINL